ncbi:MAG TPA: hypothetical protein PKE26_17240, partial [Kiritimatiellia bacterium]|nr:hypothetical protein [Saprospiraceae bacterium]HMP00845.1 hypothetical protein [Kiritimatiellia bacterium]
FGSLNTGQYMAHVVDGIHVPAEFLWSRVDRGAGDLAFDLLYFSAAVSQRIRKWRFIGLDGFDRTFAVGKVPQRAVDMLNRGWATAYAILDDSWAINWSMIPQQQPSQLNLTPKSGNNDEAINQDGISENCRKAVINALGQDVWERALEIMKRPPLIDIEAGSSLFGGYSGMFDDFVLESRPVSMELGILRFGGHAQMSETVSDAFDRLRTGSVLVVRGAGSIEGIYYRGSRSNFSNMNFLLHEVLHLIVPSVLSRPNIDLDDELALALGIEVVGNESSSQAVSRYFNSGCDPSYAPIIGTSNK